MAAQPEPQEVPYAPWEDVLAWMDHRWHPGEHLSIFGRTGSGKTYAIVYGLLPLWTRSRALIIDTKKDRGTMQGTGRVVSRKPDSWDRLPFRVREWTRGASHASWDRDPEWYKLQPPEYRWTGSREAYAKAITPIRNRVASALQMCFDQGDWLIVLDEVRDLSDPRSPGLDLEPLLTRIWREGRDRNVTLVAGTQAPTKVPAAMYDQPTYLILGKMTDARRQLRLGEIAGNRALVEDVLPDLDQHELLIMDLVYDDAVVTKVAT